MKSVTLRLPLDKLPRKTKKAILKIMPGVVYKVLLSVVEMEIKASSYRVSKTFFLN